MINTRLCFLSCIYPFICIPVFRYYGDDQIAKEEILMGHGIGGNGGVGGNSTLLFLILILLIFGTGQGTYRD